MTATTTTPRVTMRGTHANQRFVRFEPEHLQQVRRAFDPSLGAVSPPPRHHGHTQVGQIR